MAEQFRAEQFTLMCVPDLEAQLVLGLFRVLSAIQNRMDEELSFEFVL